jgi:molecular chaperone HtpG
MLEALADSESVDDKAKYQKFWDEFGAGAEGRHRRGPPEPRAPAKLYRFASTHADSGVSLADYVSRMKEGQDAIYVITADSLVPAKASPQLEIFRKKGIEVLLLVDRVDEWLLSHLMEVRGPTAAERGQGCRRPRQAAGRGREEGRREKPRPRSSRCSSA